MKPTPHVAKGFDNVYEPAEDSFFLLDCLDKDEKYLNDFKTPVIAELGTGTGVVSSFVPQLKQQRYFAIASDVNPAACECALKSWELNWPNKMKLDVIRGNVLSFLRPRTVDVLIFNPPYVPSESVPQLPLKISDQDDEWVDLALDGGNDGMEITNLVLNELETYLSPKGVAYILFCASNHPKRVCEQMSARGWISAHIDTRRAGWEILSVYRFSRNS